MLLSAISPVFWTRAWDDDIHEAKKLKGRLRAFRRQATEVTINFNFCLHNEWTRVGFTAARVWWRVWLVAHVIVHGFDMLQTLMF
jgi:hypothetical protein